MGTICIFIGLILFILSLGTGCIGANFLVDSPMRYSFTWIPSSDLEIYILFIGVCGFVGLLLCLSFVINGMTYNKLNKLYRRIKHH